MDMTEFGTVDTINMNGMSNDVIFIFMIKLKTLILEKETGGTAMHTTTPAPAIVDLYNTGKINGRVLDYGAGHGRNSNFLRDKGLKVYAYDPFNGTSVDGYVGVSNELPKDNFDVAFTSFVLNVLDETDEDAVISKLNNYASRVYHIIRNKDILDMIKNALKKGNVKVVNSFKNFGGDINNYTDEDIAKFASAGTDTIKGFQRIPDLAAKGFNLIKSTAAYKVYSN